MSERTLYRTLAPPGNSGDDSCELENTRPHLRQRILGGLEPPSVSKIMAPSEVMAITLPDTGNSASWPHSAS
jgi:hypothetical protein